MNTTLTAVSGATSPPPRQHRNVGGLAVPTLSSPPDTELLDAPQRSQAI